MNFVPCIRWSGGKRKQSEDIINRMPYEMDTFWIPFLGGGSVMFQLLNSNIKFKKIVASDIYKPLMDIWIMIQNNPGILLESYTEHYNKFSNDSNYYYEVVDIYNKQSDNEKDPLLFHFITRSCMRGSIEFDRYGNFVTKLQTPSGNDNGVITPSALEPIIIRWCEAIRDVEFRCESYECIADEVQQGDYCFFDPPYIDGNWYHDKNIDMDMFYNFLRCLPCDYSITLNGDKDIYPIPADLYTMHEYIYYGITRSSNGSPSGSRDSIWMRHNRGKYDKTRINAKANARNAGGYIPRNNEFKVVTDMDNRLNIIDQKLDKILSLLEIIGGQE